MKGIFLGLTGFFGIWATVRNCRLIQAGEVAPVPATWFVFSAANLLALVSYFSAEGEGSGSIVGAAANITWAVLGWVTFSFVMRYHDRARKKFEATHIACIVVAALGLVAWHFSRSSFVGNLFFQGVLALAYVPTMHRLWISTKSTESIGCWAIGLCSSVCGLMPAVMSHEQIQVIYCLRSIICTLIVMSLILCCRLKARFCVMRLSCHDSRYCG